MLVDLTALRRALRHGERSEAIQPRGDRTLSLFEAEALDCFASLAMTAGTVREAH